MKKLILLIVLFLSITINAQIEKIDNSSKEIKIAPLGKFQISATYGENDVFVHFRDETYVSFDYYDSFSISNSDWEELYKLMTNPDNKKGDFYKINTLDNKILYIKMNTMLGIVYPSMSVSGSYQHTFIKYMTKGQIKKLFNKN